MLRGSWVYVVNRYAKQAYIEKYHVTGVKQILLAGPVADGEVPSHNSFRERDLVQLYTDPGGVRTLAAADVWLREIDAKRALTDGS